MQFSFCIQLILTQFMLTGNYGYIFTPNDYNFFHGFVSTTGQSSIVFEVKACNDGHLELCRAPWVEFIDCYEVVLGGANNQKSFIRDRRLGPNRAVANTPNILDCKRYKTFWVSWIADQIAVGKGGAIGVNRFMSWEDSRAHPVNVVSFATGWGSSGRWRMRFLKGMAFFFISL